MSQQKVIVVGAGFGGIKAALELAKDERIKVTIISDRQFFHYYPTLYHTATGGLTAQSQIPLKTIFAHKDVTLVEDKAVKLDRRAKKLVTASGTVYEYDTIILALGTVTNYFGIEGLKEYAYGIKSIDEINRFKDHIHKQLIDERKPDLHYVIVGGGPTGIELAGALPSYLHRIMKNHGIKNRSVHVDLVEGAPRLMPRMPKSTSRAIRKRLRALGVNLHLGKPVQGETADALMVGGKPIRSHTVVWTAGMTNNPFFNENSFAFGPRGKVAVNVYLQADDDVYVIGDNANTPYSGMAQTAVNDGSFVAKNIIRLLDGKDPRPYKPRKPIYVTPVGHGWAAVLWGKVEIFGWFGYSLREMADAKAFSELEPLMTATKQWFTEFGEQEDCTVCKHALVQSSS
jgi:NADH:ubiquinone reductase (H+-translocating)